MNIVLNETIFSSLEICASRYEVITSKLEDDGSCNSSNSGSFDNLGDYEKTKKYVFLMVLHPMVLPNT